MTEKSYSRDAVALLHLAPQEISLGTAAALLGGDDAYAAATAAAAELERAGDLAPVVSAADIATLPGAPAPRWRRTRTGQPAAPALPRTAAEREALRWMAERLLVHAYAATVCLEPDEHRYEQPDLADLPVFRHDADALAWMDAERESLPLVQQQLLDSGDHTLVRMYGEATWSYYRHRRRVEDQMHVQRLAAWSAELSGHHAAASVAWSRVAWAVDHLASLLGDLDRRREALETVDRALGLAERADDPVARATAYEAQGRAYDGLGKYELALRAKQTALRIDLDRVVIGTGHPPYTAIARDWTGIAHTHLAAGEYPDAIDAADTAIEELDNIEGRHREKLRARLVRCRALTGAGRAGEALAELDTVRSTVDRVTDAVDLARVEEACGDAATGVGHISGALEAYRTAVELYEQDGQHDLADRLRRRVPTVDTPADEPPQPTVRS